MSFDLKLLNGDLLISNTGDLQIVRDNEKIRQDVLKMLITPTGGNKAHPWYGSDVGPTLIGSVFDRTFSVDVATQQIKSSIENLQIIQKTQAQTQNVTAAETILAIKDVYINTNPQDQRVLELKVSLITNALTPIDVKFYVRL